MWVGLRIWEDCAASQILDQPTESRFLTEHQLIENRVASNKLHILDFATVVIFTVFRLARVIVHYFIYRLTMVSEIRIVKRDFRKVLEP
jgi:hypothetical protein